MNMHVPLLEDVGILLSDVVFLMGDGCNVSVKVDSKLYELI